MLTLIMVLIIVFFGFRPQSLSSVNGIHWQTAGPGLVFQNPAFAYVDSLNIFRGTKDQNESTIVLSISPENSQKLGFKPILTLHDGSDQRQLTISQWGDSIIVMNGDDYNYQQKLPRVSAENILTTGEPICLAVSSDRNGTRLFKQGQLVAENPAFTLTVPNDGDKLQLVLGNSVYGNHSWEGVMYNLAIYDRSLPQEQIEDDCNRWRNGIALSLNTSKHLRLLFNFASEKDHLVQDQTGLNPDLRLPLRPLTLRQSFLAMPWRNFSLNANFIADTLINFFGFIPLGWVLCLRLSYSSVIWKNFPARASLLICFLLSLTIELSQGWLPYRTSSMLDLLMNTSGAGLGALLAISTRTRAGKLIIDYLLQRQ